MEAPKKKRGRKPKKKSIEDEKPKIKKKRGRKPKPKPINTETVKKVHKKRGRKPKVNVLDKNLNVYNSIGNVNIINDEYENIILHLPIKSSDIIDNDFTENLVLNYKPSLKDPEPFEPNDSIEYAKIDYNENDNKKVKKNIEKVESEIIIDDEFSTVKNTIKDKVDDKEEPQIILVNKKIRNVQYEFIDGNNRKEWPLSVNIACNWCCHRFEGPPCAIPIKVTNGKFYVTGCFCSFNCAAANIFDKNSRNMWEQYSLLILLYKAVYNKNIYKIPVSPPKESLKMFGGYYTIEEYRKSLLTNEKIYKIVQPPMISLVPKIEENKVNFEFKNNNKQYIPLDNRIVDTAKESLRLKRSKPIANIKNTLQSYMNLKVV
jgi:hypothetical protein